MQLELNTMFEVMRELKQATFYRYNYSASNPIVGKVVSINEKEEKVRMYITIHHKRYH